MRRSTLLALLALALCACPALASDPPSITATVPSSGAVKIAAVGLDRTIDWFLGTFVPWFAGFLVTVCFPIWQKINARLKIQKQLTQDELARTVTATVVKATEEGWVSGVLKSELRQRGISKLAYVVDQVLTKLPDLARPWVEQLVLEQVQADPAMGATGKLDAATPTTAPKA
jgi:hypothetical protein